MEYNKKKLEDMTTDEVVELFTKTFKEFMDKVNFNEHDNEEWVFLCDQVGLEFVLKNYKVKDDNTFEVMFQKARLIYRENFDRHLVLYRQPIDNKISLKLEYPKFDIPQRFDFIGYPQAPSHYPHNDYPNLKPTKKNKKKVGKHGV